VPVGLGAPGTTGTPVLVAVPVGVAVVRVGVAVRVPVVAPPPGAPVVPPPVSGENSEDGSVGACAGAAALVVPPLAMLDAVKIAATAAAGTRIAAAIPRRLGPRVG
jgi:hypothetical protein